MRKKITSRCRKNTAEKSKYGNKRALMETTDKSLQRTITGRTR
jgi:hypothetical protein